MPHHALLSIASPAAMLIRKSPLLTATYSGLHSLAAPQAQSSTSSTCLAQSTRQQHAGCHDRKCYATIAGDPGQDHDNHRDEWPKPPNGSNSPTPYQIFALKQNEAYSKSRFYELVKLYHPDKSGNGNGAGGIPRHIKAERYRLIVAANTILSDPAKRSAYDRFGAGWEGRKELDQRYGWNRSGSDGQAGPFSQNWNDPGDPVWQNATWEDWERYHERRAQAAQGVRQERQSPLYMQNGYFVVLIAILALVGSGANYNRAQDAGAYYIEQRDLVHDRAAKELRKVRQDAQGLRGREERIQWFVRNREATLGVAGSDVHAMREERADRLLPDREVCRSEDVSERPT